MAVAVTLLLVGVCVLWPVATPLGPTRPDPGSPDAGARRVPRLRERLSRPPSGRAVGADVLALLDIIGPALEAGLSPASALQLARGLDADDAHGETEVARLAGEIARAADEGRPLGPSWHAAATSLGSAELTFLAQAWSLTEELGAPLAEAVRTATEVLRSRIAQERRLASAVAGARATMTLLTLLPLGGPCIAPLLGVGLGDLYLGSGVAVMSLLSGAALVALGRWWVSRLVGAVARGPALR